MATTILATVVAFIAGGLIVHSMYEHQKEHETIYKIINDRTEQIDTLREQLKIANKRIEKLERRK